MIWLLVFPLSAVAKSAADARLSAARSTRVAAQVVQLHGHLGPSVVAGARMGMIGLRAVAAKGYFDVEVTCEGPLARPPQACFLDGIQAGPGAPWESGRCIGRRPKGWRCESEHAHRQDGRVAAGAALLELLGSLNPQEKGKAGPGPSQPDHAHLEAIARGSRQCPGARSPACT